MVAASGAFIAWLGNAIMISVFDSIVRNMLVISKY